MPAKSTNRPARREDAPSPAGSGGPPWVLIVGMVAVAAIAAVLLYPRGSTLPLESAAAQVQAEADEPPDVERPIVETRPSSPKPPPDAEHPPLPLVPNLIPRSPEVISEAYAFAAENPDILEYVPCFCGCETAGHTGNASCFVQERNPDGTVREWDRHGMSCMVCVDVARFAQQLHASGASVRDIRTAVESQYASSPRMTPTPAPPSAP